MKVIICPGVLNVTVGSLGTHFISRFDADNLGRDAARAILKAIKISHSRGYIPRYIPTATPATRNSAGVGVADITTRPFHFNTIYSDCESQNIDKYIMLFLIDLQLIIPCRQN